MDNNVSKEKAKLKEQERQILRVMLVLGGLGLGFSLLLPFLIG